MKVIKLDRRYANYPKYKFAINHNKDEKWNGRIGPDRLFQIVLQDELTRQYGPNFEWLPGTGFKRKWNEHWNYNRARQRFYFKDEAMISHIMLLLS